MKSSIILIIFLSLTKFGETKQDLIGPKTTDIVNDTNSNGIDLCLGKKCINKCCRFNQHVVYRKKCVDSFQELDFSKTFVYDEEVYETNKSVSDVFALRPGKFTEDPQFQNVSMHIKRFGHNTYIIENGDLKIELPNVYYRWSTIKTENYCIDFVMTKRGNLSNTPVVWVVTQDEQRVVVENNSTLYLICASIVSCFFMILVLVVYSLLPELQNLSGKIMMAYVASLLMAYLNLISIQMYMHTPITCVILTLATYYCFLASFCWLSVMSYDVWWTMRGYAKTRPINRRGEDFKFILYCLYAFGVPLLMTIGFSVVNSVDMKEYPWFVTPHVPDRSCFLQGAEKMLYLYTPMLILIIGNWIFYLMTAFNIWRLNRRTSFKNCSAAGTPANHRSQKNRFMVYLKLSVIMGLNWILEIASFVYPGSKFWYISDTYNMLIGLVIFFIFVCRKKVIMSLRKRLGVDYAQPTSSSSKSYNNNSASEIITLDNSTYYTEK